MGQLRGVFVAEMVAARRLETIKDILGLQEVTVVYRYSDIAQHCLSSHATAQC